MLKDQAMEIALKVNEILGFTVIITDENAIVIGTNDESRLGSYHEASIEVIHQKTQKSHNNSAAKALKGVLPGTTVPIEADGKVVGTIAIGGDPEEVAKYGLLIKSQAELFIKEQILMQAVASRTNKLQYLIQEICFFDARYTDEFPL
jgi:carbohydrate diacid regulator